MDETMEMQDKIQGELKLDPVDKEVVVLYQGEQGDSSNQFWKVQFILKFLLTHSLWGTELTFFCLFLYLKCF